GAGVRRIGDGDMLVVERARGVGHLLERALAVGGGRVHRQVAADVLELDEPRQAMLAGERDLAARLAQLGRHPVEAERVVDLGFGLSGYPPRTFEQSVLVEL